MREDMKTWIPLVVAMKLAAMIFGIGCRSDSPVAPTPATLSDTARQPVAGSGVVPPVPPSSTSGATANDPELGPEFSGQGITSFQDGKARGVVTLDGTAGSERYAALAVYQFTSAGGSNQQLVGLKEHSVAPGTTRQFFVPFKTQCETTYQADFVNAPPPEEIFNGVVPNLITPLSQTAAKWTSEKCEVGCALGQIELVLTETELTDEKACFSLEAPVVGVFSGNSGLSRRARKVNFCLDRRERDWNVKVFWENDEGCEADLTFVVPRKETCEEQNPPSFQVFGPGRVQTELGECENGLTRRRVEFEGVVEFFNAGGTAEMLWQGVVKDRASLKVACGESGAVRLYRKWEACGFPTHWDSTFTISADQ